MISKIDIEEHIDHELLILNLRLLCQFKSKTIVNKLKQHFYPIDDCIKIVREFKVDEAEAYLLERSGAVHDALDL